VTATAPFGRTLSPVPAFLRASPWGAVEDATEHAPGVWFVSTPGHGGFMVNAAAALAMPRGLRSIGMPWGGLLAFEEDCAYAAVVLAFPDAFAPAAVEVARRFVASWYPRHANGAEGCDVSQVGGSFHRCNR